MRHYPVISALLGVLLFSACTSQPKASDVLDALCGSWKGDLLYVDYGSGSEVHIPVNLKVHRLDMHSWMTYYAYPEEPEEGSADTLVLSADGTMLDDMTIAEVPCGQDTLRMMLEQRGTDDDKPAWIRKRWVVTPDSCTMTKEVSLRHNRAYKLRHRYAFARSAQVR